MTLRTTSAQRQRQVWKFLVILGVVAYFILVLAFGLGNPFRFFGPHQMRVLLPLVVILRILAHECRWDGITREVKSESKEGNRAENPGREEPKREAEVEERNLATGAAEPLSPSAGQVRGEATSPSLQRQAELGANRPVHSPIPTLGSNSVADESTTGEELFEQARAIPHQPIPDFGVDGPYLGLLGRSAAAGYAPALAKLGEYAMRRGTWVEAYYWMKQAQRNGMRGLSPALREIRKSWSLAGFYDELENVNVLFSAESGSIGRALLHVDSGHGAAPAREFLKANFPDFL